MPRKPLSQLDDWEITDADLDLRGRMLLDQMGRPVGRIAEMVVDTDNERIDAIVLEEGTEYSTDDFHFVGKDVVLVRSNEGRHGPIMDGSAVLPDEAATSDEARVIDLRKEELEIHKHAVETGQVEIRKEVVTEQETIDVPITREVVIVEHQRTDPTPADRPIDGQTYVIRLPVREERVEVEKVAVVAEEIAIGTRAVERTEQVSTTVHREEVVVETQGNLRAEGQATRIEEVGR